jgi:hypothetical protein
MKGIPYQTLVNILKREYCITLSGNESQEELENMYQTEYHYYNGGKVKYRMIRMDWKTRKYRSVYIKTKCPYCHVGTANRWRSMTNDSIRFYHIT